MLLPTQVEFRGLDHSDALETMTLEQVASLERFYQHLVSCRVVIELPNRHRRDGRHFHVTVELTVPGGEPIIVSHEPSMHGPLKDMAAAEHEKGGDTDNEHRYAQVAIRDAFDVARRRLQDFARRQRGSVKTHSGPEEDAPSQARETK